MANSTVKISPINQLIKRLPKNRLNPAAQPAALIEIIARGYTKNFELDSTEFRVLKEAVRLMLHNAWALNKLFLNHDHDLTRSPDRPLNALPEWSAYDRSKKIFEARERLQSESACYEDIEHGMNVVVTAFQSMYTEFLYAVMPDTDTIPEDHRNMWAALLGPTVRLLKRKWLPVQESANRRSRRRS